MYGIWFKYLKHERKSSMYRASGSCCPNLCSWEVAPCSWASGPLIFSYFSFFWLLLCFFVAYYGINKRDTTERHSIFPHCSSPTHTFPLSIVPLITVPLFHCHCSLFHCSTVIVHCANTRLVFGNVQKTVQTWRVLYILTWNVLCATVPCNFATYEIEKNVFVTTAACNFWFLLSPHDSAPTALTSLLLDSPDTRIIEKTQQFATYPTIWRVEKQMRWSKS